MKQEWKQSGLLPWPGPWQPLMHTPACFPLSARWWQGPLGWWRHKMKGTWAVKWLNEEGLPQQPTYPSGTVMWIRNKCVLYDCENNHWFLLTPNFLLMPQLLFQPNRTNWVFSHLLGSDNDRPSVYCLLLLRIKVFHAWDQTRRSLQEHNHCPHWVFSLVGDTQVNRWLWCQVIFAMGMDPQGCWGTLKRDPNPAVKHSPKRW